MTSSGLSLRGICKRYGATAALDGVDLDVARGRIVGLMGANGAGKSTLAQIAAGAVVADAGVVSVDGRSLRPDSPRAARRAGIAVVHQRTEWLGVPGLSVAENLLLDRLSDGRSGFASSPKSLRAQAQAVAAHLDLRFALDRDFGELGPAERQLIAIARAVSADPAVLILDEPTASLSAAEAMRLFAALQTLRERGVGVLYISHRLADLRQLADAVVVLRNGRRVGEFPRPLDTDAALRAMLGAELSAMRSVRRVEPTAPAMLEIKAGRLHAHSAAFDLRVARGEIVAVVGALGAGKSRLLGTLFGIKRWASGSVLLEGRPYAPRDPAHAIAQGVCYAGADRWRSSLLPGTCPGADIAGSIALPHLARWMPHGRLRHDIERAAATRAIQELGIVCAGADDLPERLSGGNQQKVVLARWLAAPSRLLLLDEPFQGIDIAARRDLIESLRHHARDNAVLLATSDIEEALEVADVVAVMRDQAIVAVHRCAEQNFAALLESLGAASRDAPQVIA